LNSIYAWEIFRLRISKIVTWMKFIGMISRNKNPFHNLSQKREILYIYKYRSV
jgi:hypothetical protein